MSRDVDVWRFSLDAPVQVDARRLSRSRTRVAGVRARPARQAELVDGDGLEFSWAHSGGVGVLAVTRGRDVGVDVERIEPRRALGPIADQLFAADEAAELRSLPEERRIRRFFELWTQKEAYAKALGTGHVGSAPPSCGHRAAGRSHDLQLGPGHVGALCVRGRPAPRSHARMTVGEVVKASTEFLARKDVPSPRVDAEHLVAHALGHHAPRPLPPVRPAADGGGDGRLPRARPAARHARAARVHPRRVGVPAADAEGGLARAHPAAGDRGRRRALPRAARGRRRRRWCSTSARARGRSRSPSRTSGRTPR